MQDFLFIPQIKSNVLVHYSDYVKQLYSLHHNSFNIPKSFVISRSFLLDILKQNLFFEKLDALLTTHQSLIFIKKELSEEILDFKLNLNQKQIFKKFYANSNIKTWKIYVNNTDVKNKFIKTNIVGEANLFDAILFAWSKYIEKNFYLAKNFEYTPSIVLMEQIDYDASGVIYTKDINTNQKNIIIRANFSQTQTSFKDEYIVSYQTLEIINKKIGKQKFLIKNGNNKPKIKKLILSKQTKQVLDDKLIKKIATIAWDIKLKTLFFPKIKFGIKNKTLYIEEIVKIQQNFEKYENQNFISRALAINPGLIKGKIVKINKKTNTQDLTPDSIGLIVNFTKKDISLLEILKGLIITGKIANSSLLSYIKASKVPTVVAPNFVYEVLDKDDIVIIDSFDGRIFRLPQNGNKTSKTKIKKTRLPCLYIKNIEDIENIEDNFKSIIIDSDSFFEKYKNKSFNLAKKEIYNVINFFKQKNTNIIYKSSTKFLIKQNIIKQSKIKSFIKNIYNPQSFDKEIEIITNSRKLFKKNIDIIVSQVHAINELKFAKKILLKKDIDFLFDIHTAENLWFLHLYTELLPKNLFIDWQELQANFEGYKNNNDYKNFYPFNYELFLNFLQTIKQMRNLSFKPIFKTDSINYILKTLIDENWTICTDIQNIKALKNFYYNNDINVLK